ncbi:DUF4012 domain-containing protein [Candidatus Uhrbacteria bacterium]|nr:DUF4012 domain-containing protein [Candidatus Uhrbacteria bacterium]
MPRKMGSVKIKTVRKKKTVVSKSKEKILKLEAQLSAVLERPGATISIARSRRSHKKPRKPTVLDFQDAIHALDQMLVGGIGRAQERGKAKRVKIHFGSHQPSTHKVSLPRLKRGPLVSPSPPLDEPPIHKWMAPFEFPPSLEEIIAAVNDLHISEIDPRAMQGQFTIGQSSRRVSGSTTQGAETAPLRLTIDQTWFISQFTPSDPDQAFQAVYGWSRRLVDQFSFVRNEEAREEKEEEPVWAAPAWSMKRVMIGFCGLLLVVSLPAGAISFARSLSTSVEQVTQHSHEALNSIHAAIRGSGSDQMVAWRQASERFTQADQALSQMNASIVALAQLLPQTRTLYRSAHELLNAGDSAAQAGKFLSEGLQHALQDPVTHADERLITFSTYLEAASRPLSSAVQSVGRLSIDRLPSTVRPQANELKDALSSSQTSLRELRAITDVLISAAGHNEPRRYLLVFQNHTELRPSGGFMGSLAEIEVDRGEITKVFVPAGGPYDLRDQLNTRVLAPEPLQLISARWELQDANWFPDFPATARKIQWFWSKSGQASVDGVIAINAHVMEKLLAFTGPIDLPEYGKVITAENFLIETQKAVELEYDRKENKPKKIIGDLLEQVLVKFKTTSHEDWPSLVGLFNDSLTTKDVQIYFTRADEDALAHRFGWRGEMKPVQGDTLSLIEANIAGQKTDGVIPEIVTHDVDIQEDGQIVDTVTLTRRHLGKKGELFRGVNNVSYLRVYVPEGSMLISADGFHPPPATLFKQPLASDQMDTDLAALVSQQEQEQGSEVTVTHEFGRTAFGGWLQLEPGETSVTHFKYRLPFTAFDMTRSAVAAERAAYLLLLTSQSGKPNRQIVTQIHLPATWRISWSNRDTNSSNSSTLRLTATWDRDQVLAGLFNISHE